MFKINPHDTVAEVSKVQAPSASSGDAFGSSIAISANYMVVGASNYNANSGSAYLFKIDVDGVANSGFRFEASDVDVNDSFASSVAIDGNYVVVGAKYEDTNSTNGGSAYLYKISNATTLTELAKLNPSETGVDDNFGASVDISGDYIVVGARKQDNADIDSGSAYLFKRNSDTLGDVTELDKLEASDATANDYFATSVSIDLDYIVVGASGGDGSGSGYVYNIVADNNITEVEKLVSPLNGVNDYYGWSVSISGNDVAIGDYKEDVLGTDTGGVYVYTKD